MILPFFTDDALRGYNVRHFKGGELLVSVKVLHVTYDMGIGGTEMVIKNIIEGFAGSYPDVDFSLFCIEKPLGPWGQELENKGIPIHSYSRRQGFDWSLIWAIRRVVREQKIDILHCHQYTPWVYGLLASFWTRAKVIFTEHGRFYPDASSWKRRMLNPWFSRLTDATTAISRATKQALVDYEAIKPSAISIIYNGIVPLRPDLAKVAKIRSDIGVADNHVLFGTVARFDPIKNQVMMLRAFARVAARHPGAWLLMVGDGVERVRLQALCQQLEIGERVFFSGYISNPVNHLGAMDVFLLSSLSEGTSMTLLEAMSLGKPCIVTDSGGNPEIIVHEDNGLVTSNNDEAAFAVAMEALLADPAKSAFYSRQAKERFTKNFVVENMVKQYFTLYQGLFP
ncbi:Putative glycosyltransferase EpsD [Thiorhodovibrio winogradskyi]|uniref:Glycosyltransferase EpsD n=1 Tax=Thiorhodovibrio winogradskyi TaxID=77007 RepID=A0ABZ0SC60_9GAMM|nr:glycosyltransferase [Thiorhodovibrio winogradskyi]